MLTRRAALLALIVMIGLLVWAALAGGGSGALESDPAVVTQVSRVPGAGTLVPGSGTGAPREPVALVVTSAQPESDDESTGSPVPRQEATGRVIARWASSTTPDSEEVRLALVPLREQGEGLAQGAGPVLRLGPRSHPMIRSPAGEPLAPDGASPGERVWSAVSPGAWQVVAVPNSPVVPEDAPLVHVRAHATRVVELQLGPAGVVHVRIELPDGRPVSGAEVRVVGPLPAGLRMETTDPGELVGVTDRRCTTDEQGEFEVRGVSPGAWYGVHAWTADGTRATGEVRAQVLPDAPETLVATPPVEVLVRVLDRETGAPVGGVPLVIVDNRLQALSGVAPSRDIDPLQITEPTDERGEVRVRCEPGAWVITRSDSSDLCTLQLSESAVAAGEVVLYLDRVDLGILRVTRPDGTPVSGARVEGRWSFWDASREASGELSPVQTDARGEFPLAALGELPQNLPAALDLHASHPRDGIGGIRIGLENLPPHVRPEEGMAPVPKSIIIRPAGSLELSWASDGWPEPPPVQIDARWNAEDLAEQDDAARGVRFTLRYLGSSALRSETSRQHGEHRGARVGRPGDDERVVFEDLEPGCYAVSIESRARQLVFTTPPLWVRPGETTVHWVAPPAREALGQVALDVGAAGYLGEATATRNTATLRAEVSAGYLVGSSLLQPSIAGEGDAGNQVVPADGRVVFQNVHPGRYTIGLWLPDASGGPGERVYRLTEAFDVGPGDDLLLRQLEEVPAPPGAAALIDP